jgi:hypothetical protein
MTTAKSDLINGIVTQTKQCAWWTVLTSVYFGSELAAAMWEPHDDFYPFGVLLLGAMTVISFLGSRGALVRLTYAVELADAGAMRTKTRKVLVSIFGAACISLSFGLFVVASKRFGGLYPVAAAVLGVLLLWIGFLMHRGIKRLASYS